MQSQNELRYCLCGKDPLLKNTEFCFAGVRRKGDSFMRVVREGKEIEIDVMTKAIIEYKGNKVGIGSGWCEWDRRQFFVRPQDIVGKIATIKYFEETRNKNGGYALRFPVAKIVHDGERTV